MSRLSSEYEHSITEIAEQICIALTKFSYELSLTSSYSAPRRGKSANISSNFQSPSPIKGLNSILTTNSFVGDSCEHLETSSANEDSRNKSLAQDVLHLLECMSNIRTYNGRTTLLEAGAIAACFELIELLNNDKKRGGLERGVKVKEAACFAIWCVLQDFPDGQEEACR